MGGVVSDQEREREPTGFRDLLALLAHDMRNPLAALLTNVNFVRGSADRTTEVEEALADAILSCNVLERLIANVDVLARAASAGVGSRRAIRLRAAVNEAVTRIRPQAALVEVDLDVVATDLDPVIWVESDAFGRALDNVLSNALQYSPARAKVSVEVSRHGDRAVVTVL